ncbi:MAG: TlpA disulfide reductase family protein [Nocardioides sp.]|uniref:TlpA disulfide reductase family protein n=1 Tax=Nocardioides sp. TaxID=35761 RepID=UPI003F0EB3AE
MRRWRTAAVAGAATVALVLAGCSDAETPFVPAPPKIEVDTPEMAALKAEIGMEDCASVVPADPGGPVEGGLPEVTLPCLGGGSEVDLSTLRGPMVINLWQAFCQPCIKEMPALQQFHEKYGDQVAVLGIDFNDVRPLAALELAQETGVTYPSVADPGAELTPHEAFKYSRVGLPAFAFIDADGTVVGGSNGLDGQVITTLDDVVALVDAHLGIDVTESERGGRP